MPSLFRAHLALFTVNLMYGANYLVAKGLMPEVISPNGFIFLRVSGSVFLFWLIYAFRFEKIDQKDWVRLIFCGLFGVAVNQLFFFNGLMLTSPFNAPVIMTATPIIVLILSLIILKEKVRFVQYLGIGLGLIGCLLFILQNNPNSKFATSRGDLFILFNAASYSLYLVLVKPIMAKYNPITVITWVFTFGLVFVSIWPLSIQEAGQVEWSGVTTNELLRLMFVIIGVTFVPYLLNIYALKAVSPSISATYIYLQPILASIFVFVFSIIGLEDYTEDITLLRVSCSLLVFVGVYLVVKPSNQKIKT